MESLVVVPVHPSQRGELDLLDGLPRAGVGGAADQLGLVVAVDGLSQRVDAPILVKSGLGTLSRRGNQEGVTALVMKLWVSPPGGVGVVR